MKVPAALVFAVLTWSAARYLPPYYLEMRKLDLEEEKVDFVKTRADVLFKASLARQQAVKEASALAHTPRFD